MTAAENLQSLQLRRSHPRKKCLPSKTIDKSIRIMEQTIKNNQEFLFLKGDYRLLVEDLIYESAVFPKSRSTITWSAMTKEEGAKLTT